MDDISVFQGAITTTKARWFWTLSIQINPNKGGLWRLSEKIRAAELDPSVIRGTALLEASSCSCMTGAQGRGTPLAMLNLCCRRTIKTSNKDVNVESYGLICENVWLSTEHANSGVWTCNTLYFILILVIHPKVCILSFHWINVCKMLINLNSVSTFSYIFMPCHVTQYIFQLHTTGGK